MAIHLGRPSPNASRDRPEWQPRKPDLSLHLGPRHPYLVLLLVGFALPPPLPAARCALTSPFHPCRRAKARRRSAFCGTFPGVTPAGCYPAPCFRGARTFLPRPKWTKAAIRLSDAAKQSEGYVKKVKGPTGANLL